MCVSEYCVVCGYSVPMCVVSGFIPKYPAFLTKICYTKVAIVMLTGSTTGACTQIVCMHKGTPGMFIVIPTTEAHTIAFMQLYCH